MATIEEIKNIVNEIRIAKNDNKFETDLEKTTRQLEEINKISIKKEIIIKEELNDEEILYFSKFSGNVKKINDKEFYIKISPFDFSRRQNFTLAHELGHIALNHEFPEDNLIEEGKENTLARSLDPSDPREVAANKFSAELLMPQHLIEAYFPEKRISEEDIKGASDKFSVSKAAMMVRLDSLNYIFK